MCVQTNLRSTMRMGIPRRLRALIYDESLKDTRYTGISVFIRARTICVSSGVLQLPNCDKISTNR